MDGFTLFHLYLIFFLLGLGYAVIAVLMGQILGGHEAGHDAGGDGHAGEHGEGGVEAHVAGMPTIAPLSPVTVATFATAFGGVGLVFERLRIPGVLSVPAAAAVGVGIAAAVFYLFFRVFRATQATSGVAVRQAVGRPAEVITAIPEKGLGEIAYVLGGRRFNAAARSEDGAAVPARATVTIVGREGAVFRVRRLP